MLRAKILIATGLLFLFYSFPAQSKPCTDCERFWLQAQIGGSLLETLRDVPAARANLGVQIGKRFSQLGVFTNFGYSQGFQPIENLQPAFAQMGVGLEFLTHSGQVRSTIAGGATRLTNETNHHPAGEAGWYVDVRPMSARWSYQGDKVIEFTLLSLEVAKPFLNTKPIFGFFTSLSIEWSNS